MDTTTNEVGVTRLVCATLGCIPIVASAWKGRTLLLFVTSVSAVLGMFGASTAVGPSVQVSSKARIIGALNAMAAVVFTLGCTMSIDIHRTIVGAIRVLWLVTLVTSSSGYVYVQELFPGFDFIPNDLALGATLLSIVLLFAAILSAKFCQHQSLRDKRAVVVELTLTAGALTLRFDDELNRILTIQLGWAIWHLSCWVSVLTSLYVLEHPTRVEAADASEVTIDFSGTNVPSEGSRQTTQQRNTRGR